MTIDLRYILPIAAFYVPGVMIVLGGFALGYSLAEMRDGVAAFGSSFGAAFSLTCALQMMRLPPLKVRIF